MRFIDDILVLFGVFCITAAAFGVDWRLGMLVLGMGSIAVGFLLGRFLGSHPEILERARQEKERAKRGEESDPV